MKTTFKIIKVDKYAVVLINNNSRITEVLNDVETTIKKKKYFGTVIFDLLLSNGLNNRFFEIPFENERFSINKIKKVEQPNNKLISKANKYYLENVNFINDAIITRIEKSNIKMSLKVVN
jgi:hypothetical protein